MLGCSGPNHPSSGCQHPSTGMIFGSRDHRRGPRRAAALPDPSGSSNTAFFKVSGAFHRCSATKQHRAQSPHARPAGEHRGTHAASNRSPNFSRMARSKKYTLEMAAAPIFAMVCACRLHGRIQDVRCIEAAEDACDIFKFLCSNPLSSKWHGCAALTETARVRAPVAVKQPGGEGET